MKKEEVLIQTENVRVRIIELAPGESAQAHHHSEITDNMFGISGEVFVRMKDPEEEVILTPGNRCEIVPRRVHQVMNRLQHEKSRYLLVQGVGTYDFLREDL